MCYAYEQATLCLGHHADLWYEACVYLQDSAAQFADRGETHASQRMADEVAVLYERAITTTMADNALLHFAYADYEETRMKYKKCEQIYKKYVDSQKNDPTLAYIQYMKFARRTDGIKACRAVFKQARDDYRCKYHVYVAAAYTEFYCSKDANIALNIFQLGLKKYSDEANYAIAYLEFVQMLNEDANTRVLFEKILTSGNLTTEKSL